MRQASGHEVKKENHVCLLLKALYGTKQAAHALQLHLKGLLTEEGFESILLDPATYVKHIKEAYVLVGTHVDDLFVVQTGSGNEGQPMDTSLLQAGNQDSGGSQVEMSIQREAEAGVIKLSEESFVTEVLRTFNLSNCKTVPTPAVDSGEEADMTEEDLPTTEEAKLQVADLPFLEVIGSLWWLAQMTRLTSSLPYNAPSH